jgi:hypothetical protein
VAEIQLLDVVVVTRDFPEHGVLAGDLGTVVECYEGQPESYEVEFINADGQTRALLTLPAEQIRPVSQQDVLAVRQAATVAV